MTTRAVQSKLTTAAAKPSVAGVATTGNIFFVDSGHAKALDSADHGRAASHPFATIDYAIGKCTADNGDVITVMANHAETANSATAFLCDKGGITIIGQGRGNNRPLISVSNTAGGLVVTSADVKVENITFVAGSAAVVRMMHIKGKYTHIKNCEILDGGASHVLVGIEIGASNNDADGSIIEGNRITQLDSASVNGILFMKDQVNCQILDNYIQGDYAVGGIKGLIAANSAENLTRVLVKGNMLISAATDQAIAINLDGPTNTGMLIGNYAAAPDADWTPFVAIGCSFHENYGSGALASSGYIYPAIDS